MAEAAARGDVGAIEELSSIAISKYQAQITPMRTWQSAPVSGDMISRGKDNGMRHLLMHVTFAVTVATVITPVQAQVPSVAVAPPQLPPAAYSGSTYQYPFPAPTPEDAYRSGLINRWQYEQLAGPLPQALRGPSVDGNRGGDGGGDRE
jgi:hypothetical protein